MKVYLLQDDDFDRLLAFVDRAPEHGDGGGGSTILTAEEREAHEKAHRFFNFQIRRWLDTVRTPARG